MKNLELKTISVRTNLEEFAKARDGLLRRGVTEEKLMSNSNILRAAILICCLLNDDTKSPATQESINRVKQLWKITQRDKNINIDNLY
jgi:hypothetical protein